MIEYRDSADDITPEMLAGFFVGWPNPPSPTTHLRILTSSDVVALVVDRNAGRVAGVAAALTDGILVAYLSMLEVLPAYQGRGIGSALVQHVRDHLGGLYAIDLMCDPDVQPFYARLGLRPAHGMIRRIYEAQSGRPASPTVRPVVP